MRRLTMCLMVVVLLGISAVPGNAQDGEVVEQTGLLRIVVTMPEIGPIVRALGGSMVEIEVIPLNGSTELSDVDAMVLTDLVITVEEFDAELSENTTNIKYLGWEDFARHGAVLKDFPGYEACPAGWWLGFDNMEAIASAIAEKLMMMGLEPSVVTSNLARFLDDVAALRVSGREMLVAVGRERSTWVAMSPEAAYIIDNLGLAVGTVAWNPETGLVTGHDLVDIENKLQSREYAGMVCAMSMHNSETGQLALQLEESTDAQIAWVKYKADESENPIIENAAYNAAAMSTAAALGDITTTTSGPPVSAHLIWALIVFVLLILLVMQNKHAHYSGGSFAPATKNSRKKKK